MAPGWREELARVAAEHPAVAHRDDGPVIAYEAGGEPFVVADPTLAEFRLRPDMVRAALRTPGTAASSRGPEWVAFSPPAELERYDIDRLTSWFEMAARLAGA